MSQPLSVSNHQLVRLILPLGLALVMGALHGCASAGPKRVSMAPMAIAGQADQAEAVAPLEQNHFTRDRSGSISEADLRRVLSAPVFLEKDARVGVVPVADGYEAENDLPIDQLPGSLTGAMEDSGLFEAVTEVSTDWPATGSISGLRELAARYRTDYLLLYRHRFIDDSYANPWAVGYITVIGAFFLPAHTLETNGVLEATLFDVKTGTILFTVFERTYGRGKENVWQNDRKRMSLKRDLLEEAAGKLGKQVVDKLGYLTAARDKWLKSGGETLLGRSSPEGSTGGEAGEGGSTGEESGGPTRLF